MMARPAMSAMYNFDQPGIYLAHHDVWAFNVTRPELVAIFPLASSFVHSWDSLVRRFAYVASGFEQGFSSSCAHFVTLHV